MGHIGPKYHLENAVFHNKIFFMGHIMLYINKVIYYMGLLNMDLKTKKVATICNTLDLWDMYG